MPGEQRKALKPESGLNKGFFTKNGKAGKKKDK